MEIQLATIDSRSASGKKNPTGKKDASSKKGFASDWLQDYATRIGYFCHVQLVAFPREDTLLLACERASGRTPPYLVLLDSRGKSMTSEALAAWLEKQQDVGTQRIIFAIGPADGWSEPTRQQANLLLSLGPMTLAHELAAVVLAEQIYRAFTILKGLPYHLKHSY